MRMSRTVIGEPALRKPLRLWLSAVAVALWLLRFVIPKLMPANPSIILYPLVGGLVGGAVFILWWVFFSREPRVERWTALALMILAQLAASQILHKSMVSMFSGMMVLIYSIPILYIAFAFWAK